MSATSGLHNHDPAPSARRIAAGNGNVVALDDLPLEQVLARCPRQERSVLSQACLRLCSRVRSLSACRLSLSRCQGRAVAALPAHRQFRGCASITYTCITQQQQQQDELEELPDQLGAVEALLQSTPQQMPQLSSFELVVGTKRDACCAPSEADMSRQAARSLHLCISALAGLPHLTSLTLTLPDYTARLSSLLGALTQLQQLKLELTDVLSSQPVQLAPLSQLVNLRSFSCAGLAAAALRNKAANTTCTTTTSSSTRGSAGSCLPANLASFDLSNCGERAEDWWPHVAATAAAGRLESVNVAVRSASEVGGLLQQLAGCAPGLRRLGVLVSYQRWSPCPELARLEALREIRLAHGSDGGAPGYGLLLSRPDHWLWLTQCLSLTHLGGVEIQWGEHVPQPPPGFLLPRLKVAHILLPVPTSVQQLAALLRCCPALDHLQLLMIMSHPNDEQQQQQQQEEDGEQQQQGEVDGDHQEQEQQQHHHHQHQQDGVAQPGSSMAHRLLPPVRIAQVRLDGPVTSGQVAALLRCFPHVQRLSLDLTLDVGQQPSPAAQHQEEQEDVADPAAGAQQQGPQPVVPRVHDAAAEAAAQLLGVPYIAATPPASGPLKALHLCLRPSSPATATSEQLQQALESLAPLFRSVINLVLDVTQWPCTQGPGGQLPDLACFPQLVVVGLYTPLVNGYHTHLVPLPLRGLCQLWYLGWRGYNTQLEQLPGSARAYLLIGCFKRMSVWLQQVAGCAQGLLSAVDALVAAEVGPWRDLLQQLEEVCGKEEPYCQYMRSGLVQVEAAAAEVRAAGAAALQRGAQRFSAPA